MAKFIKQGRVQGQNKKEVQFETMYGYTPDGAEWTLSKDENTPRITLKRDGQLVVSDLNSNVGLRMAAEKNVEWRDEKTD